MNTSKLLRKAGILLIALFASLIICSVGWTATYYLDATNGNDSNNGTSQSTPWKTISKVNSSKFNPGDQILFKRGKTWREQLVVPSSGSSGTPVTFGAYGSGSLPIITGADILASGWTQTSGTVWQASVTTEPKLVFFNRTLGTHKSSLTGVTAANQWYWAANVLYVHSTSNPATAFTNPGVEAGQRDFGIDVSWAYITIQDIHTTKTNHSGIRFSDAWAGHGTLYSPQAIRVTSDYNYNNGIMFGALGADLVDVLAENNVTSFNGGPGIEVGNWDAVITGITIQDNTIDSNNWQSTSPLFNSTAGLHITSTGNGSAYGHTLKNAVIQRNTVSNCTNQPGLWLDTVGTNVVAQYNKIYNCYYGAYVENSTAVRLSYNLIYNCPHLGIQVTRLVHNNLVYNNTVYGCGTGIAVGWTHPSTGGVTGNLIKNNISWGNSTVALSANNGGQNDGTNGSGNVYAYNMFGPEATNFITWGASIYSTVAAWQTASSQSGNLASNPLFVSSSKPDFHLQSNSPAIKRGTSVGLTRDYAGSPVGTPPTIGAYEYSDLSAPSGLRIIP